MSPDMERLCSLKHLSEARSYENLKIWNYQILFLHWNIYEIFKYVKPEGAAGGRSMKTSHNYVLVYTRSSSLWIMSIYVNSTQKFPSTMKELREYELWKWKGYKHKMCLLK